MKNKPPGQQQEPGFDFLRGKFNQNIYGTPKGRLRLDLLKEDFAQIISPRLTASSRILDAGCGEARMSSALIKAGYEVTLLDNSADMLTAARNRLTAEEVSLARVNWCVGQLEDKIPQLTGTFDLIIMHAVLEGLNEPWQALPHILAKVKPGGLFSLAFYNRHSLIYRNLLQGNFRKIKKDDWQQSSTGLTPKHPINPDELYNFMQESGFGQLSKRGIRCFYDFMRKDVRQERSYQDILEMERRYSQQDPFMSLGRYLHVIWKKIP